MEGGVGYVNNLDNLKATELRLGLPGTDEPQKPLPPLATRGAKRALAEADEEAEQSEAEQAKNRDETAPVAKAQVVGWPPVRAYRKNCFHAKNKTQGNATTTMTTTTITAIANGMYVKVSMDGAPYLRKIDLKVYKGYRELREALEAMFKCFSGVDCCNNNSNSNASEFAITYEDKDGDLMLVGDVPWDMFINSCKRLRIMRGSKENKM